MRMNSKSLSTITSGPSSRRSCFSSGERGAHFHPSLLVAGGGGMPSTFCSTEVWSGRGGPRDPGRAGAEGPGT